MVPSSRRAIHRFPMPITSPLVVRVNPVRDGFTVFNHGAGRNGRLDLSRGVGKAEGSSSNGGEQHRSQRESPHVTPDWGPGSQRPLVHGWGVGDTRASVDARVRAQREGAPFGVARHGVAAAGRRLMGKRYEFVLCGPWRASRSRVTSRIPSSVFNARPTVARPRPVRPCNVVKLSAWPVVSRTASAE